MNINCPNCNAGLCISDDLQGKKGLCNKCNKIIDIPYLCYESVIYESVTEEISVEKDTAFENNIEITPSKFWLKRFIANVIDLLLINTVLYVYSLFYEISGIGSEIKIIGALVFTFKDSFKGQSLGKAAMGLTVLRSDGKPAGVKESFVRNICVIFGITTVIAFFQMHKNKRIGDGVAKTSVVYNVKKPSPYIIIATITIAIVCLIFGTWIYVVSNNLTNSVSQQSGFKIFYSNEDLFSLNIPASESEPKKQITSNGDEAYPIDYLDKDITRVIVFIDQYPNLPDNVIDLDTAINSVIEEMNSSGRTIKVTKIDQHNKRIFFNGHLIRSARAIIKRVQNTNFLFPEKEPEITESYYAVTVVHANGRLYTMLVFCVNANSVNSDNVLNIEKSFKLYKSNKKQ